VGFVEDLEGYLRNVRITIAPLRYGAGVKGKVGNSLRMGLPVVGTPIAVEGMGLKEGEHVLVGRTGQQFAGQMQRLYTDGNLWETLSSKGQAYVLRKYGLDAARTKLANLCTKHLNVAASR
jgi:glycosyltransferase involved in cell wall biosynthesis